MAIIMFGTQQAQQQDNKSEAMTYEQFIEKATGMLTLKGRHIVDEQENRVDAKAFLSGMIRDERPLTPGIRYRDEGESFVSPLTRGRHTGWALNSAFLPVNTLIGLLSKGLQLPEYRSTRTSPRPTGGQVSDNEMLWIVGPWGPRTELRLYITDGVRTETIETWIERKLGQLMEAN